MQIQIPTLNAGLTESQQRHTTLHGKPSCCTVIQTIHNRLAGLKPKTRPGQTANIAYVT